LLWVAVGVGAFLLVLALLADARRSKKARQVLADAPPPELHLPKPKLAPKQRHYEYERKTDQVYRRVKRVPGPEEQREAILAFVESRAGVQAWVEPRTVMHPLSAVLVADDGEWVRFELRDDAYLRQLARERGLAIHDAMRVGYPERMRTYKRKSTDT
jgi:hypothetical protein